MLTLSEELFLLSLLEKKETVRIPSSLSLPFALAGAVLLELFFAGYIRHENDRVIVLTDLEQIEEERLKNVLEKIHKAGKPKKLNHWVYVFGTKGNRLSKGLALSLVQKGILAEEGKQYQWVFAENDQMKQLARSKYFLKRQIRDALLFDEKISPHDLALLMLLETCGMPDHIFTKDEIIAARIKVKSAQKAENLEPSLVALMAAMIAAIKYSVAAAVSS